MEGILISDGDKDGWNTKVMPNECKAANYTWIDAEMLNGDLF